MGIRAHRIKSIEYAERTLFKSGGRLGDILENHGDTNDFRNMDGCGKIEFPFRVLKEVLKNAKNNGLADWEIDDLKAEIDELKKTGKEDDDYIEYDMF